MYDQPLRRIVKRRIRPHGNRSVRAGRARLSPGRHNRNQTARSVWSAWSLLPLSNRATHPTAGASSTHSIRFARHDCPCHPSVQFAPYPPKICAKKQDFRLYYSARRVVAWRAEDRRALPAVTEKLAPAFEPRHTSDSGSKLHALHTLRETRPPLSSVCAICSVSPGNLRKKTSFSPILFSKPPYFRVVARRAEDRRALPAVTDRFRRC